MKTYEKYNCENMQNKLGLSYAKLSSAESSWTLANDYLVYVAAAYNAPLCSLL